MSDTPRTDAVAFKQNDGTLRFSTRTGALLKVVTAEFARQLERELAALELGNRQLVSQIQQADAKIKALPPEVADRWTAALDLKPGPIQGPGYAFDETNSKAAAEHGPYLPSGTVDKAARHNIEIYTDAMRYRFLRDSENAYPLFFIAQRDPTGIVVQFKGALVDANIDAMMKRFPPQSHPQGEK